MRSLMFFLLAGVIFLSGCMAVRTYTVEKPRTDTDIDGNQGFLYGTPKAESKESRLGPTRKISVVEVEIGSRKKQMSAYKIRAKVDEEEAADRADNTQNRVVEEIYIDEEIIREDFQDSGRDLIKREQDRQYTILKNDTLQKISQKFYGTTRRWMDIYEANKKVIKNPDRVKPGMKIRIPL